MNIQTIQDLAAAHPFYFMAGSFLLGHMGPAIWAKLLTKWIPHTVVLLMTIQRKALLRRGASKAQVREVEEAQRQMIQSVADAIKKEEEAEDVEDAKEADKKVQ